MIIPPGEYRYEIRRGRELLALEEERFGSGLLAGARHLPGGLNRHEIEATVDSAGVVKRVSLRYSRGPFTRSAVYDAAEEALRGSVSALAGRNEVVVKLGRFREVDADLILFRALMIAHVRAREQVRWTGRVAVIDSNTLVAASIKHTCHLRDATGRRWTYETRMGEQEEIEIDGDGRIIRRTDGRGIETALVSFAPAPPA